jgi:hypothetical protein
LVQLKKDPDHLGHSSIPSIPSSNLQISLNHPFKNHHIPSHPTHIPTQKISSPQEFISKTEKYSKLEKPQKCHPDNNRKNSRPLFHTAVKSNEKKFPQSRFFPCFITFDECISSHSQQQQRCCFTFCDDSSNIISLEIAAAPPLVSVYVCDPSIHSRQRHCALVRAMSCGKRRE